MGNTLSDTNTAASNIADTAKEAIVDTPDEFIENVLNQIEFKSVVEISCELEAFYANQNEETFVPLKCLAEKITQRALSRRNMCLKFVELAVKLSSSQILCFVNPNRQEEDLTFKDVFLKTLLETFDYWANHLVTFTDIQKEFCYATFFGGLFSSEVISCKLISYLLRKIDDRPEQKDLLIAIKRKVFTEYLKASHDSSIDLLIEKMFQQNLFRDSEYLDSLVLSNRVQKQRPKVEQSVPLTSRATTSRVSQQQTNSNLVTDFETFLDNIQQNPKPMIDLSKFKTSSDEERKNCSKAMFDRILSCPVNIVSYADIAREILCRHSASSQTQKTFCNHLSKICEDEMEKLFMATNIQIERETNLIGLFLSELYVRECVQNAVMNKWLDNILALIKDNEYFKTLLMKSLTIIMPKMKQRDGVKYKLCIQHIKELDSEGKIPTKYVQWSKSVLKEVFSSSVNSVSSLTSNIATSKPTGAIQKELPSMNQQLNVTICPSSQTNKPPTNVIDKFCNLISKLSSENLDLIVVETKKLKIDGTEKNMRKVANILISRVKCNPSLIVPASLILLWFPSIINPPINQKNFMSQIKLSLISQLTKHIEGIKRGNTQTIAQTTSFIFLIKELHSKYVIDKKTVADIHQNMVDANSVQPFPLLGIFLNDFEDAFPMLFQKPDKKSLRILPSNETTAVNSERSTSESSVVSLATSNGAIKKSLPSINQEHNLTLKPLSQSERLPSIIEINKFYDLVQKLSSKNLDLIFADIKKLKITESVESMKKVANILINRAKYNPDLIAPTTLILLWFPTILDPPINQENFMTPIKLSLTSHLITHIKEMTNGSSTNANLTSFVHLIIELHTKSVIDIPALEEVLHNVVDAFDGEPVPLQAIGNFIKIYEDEFLSVCQNISQREKIENFIPSNETESNDDTEQVKDITPQPEKSSNQIESSNESKENKFSAQLFDLEVLEMDEFIKYIDKVKIENSIEMKKFASAFYEFIMKFKLSQVYGGIAQLIDDSFSSKKSNISAVSFKECLIEIHQSSNKLEQINQEHNAKEKQTITEFVKFTGQLYNMGWIHRDQLIALMNKLVENNFEQMNMFKNLLHAISLTLIKNGDGEICSRYYEILSRRQENFKTVRKYLTYVGVLNTLKTISELSKASVIDNNQSAIEKRHSVRDPEQFDTLKENEQENHRSTNATSKTDLNLNMENILMEITDDDKVITMVSTALINYIDTSAEKQKAFIDYLWSCLMKKSELVSSYAKLCNFLSTSFTRKSTDLYLGIYFKAALMTFLQNRISTFNQLTNDKWTKIVRDRLATVMIFICDLYVLGIVPDGDLEALLKPAKRLSRNNLSKVISILAPKINSTGNVRLMALLMNLEDLTQEGTKEFWKELTEDIEEINKLVVNMKLKLKAKE